MALYRFVTTWRLQAPVLRVWETLMRPAEYSRWWKHMVDYRLLTPGVTGVGSISERKVRGRLPYTLCYRTTVTHFDPPNELSYTAEGDLCGKGRMVVRPTSEGCEVVYYWDVQTKGFWMNLLSPLLKWLFAWNHNRVMKEGERGLRHYLASEGQS